GYFAEPLQKLRRRFETAAPYPADTDRTIVRPTFSTLGSYSMSDEALAKLIKIILQSVPGVAKLLRHGIKMEKYGIVLDLDLSILLGFNAQEVPMACQLEVAEKVEQFTAINVLATNVRALRVEKPHSSQEPVKPNTAHS